MDEKPRHYFERGDLAGFTFRERLLIKLADLVFYSAISIFGRTFRAEVVGEENLPSNEAQRPAPLFAIWHEHIFTGAYILRGRKIVVLASQSFDGEYIARFLTRFGFGAVRGSSSRGGLRALAEMRRAVEDGFSALITVDGPKGPVHVAKAGICTLAKRTGSQIIPIAVEPARFWRVGSWDGLRIPKPFTPVRLIYGPPVAVGGADDVDDKAAELQARLDELDRSGELWRTSINVSHT